MSNTEDIRAYPESGLDEGGARISSALAKDVQPMLRPGDDDEFDYADYGDGFEQFRDTSLPEQYALVASSAVESSGSADSAVIGYSTIPTI